MQRVATLLDEALAAGLGSAAAVSVGDAGREVFRATRGHAWTGGAVIDERAWFDVASLTKPMATAAAAMVLVGEGRLALDAPIRQYLREAASTGTVAQLLGHAAGCAPHVEFWKRAGRLDRASLVAQAAAEPASAPGIAAVYSDLGYITLGAVIERAAEQPLEELYRELVAEPLAIAARFPGEVALAGAVATEAGVAIGLVHDENARYGGGVCGHAGLFATIDDVACFAEAISAAASGIARGRLRPDVVQHFLSTASAPATSWRLGWDTPSRTPGVSHAGDRWPRDHAVGHLGFTGTSLWLDLARRRWVALLTNRVHPTREGTADAIKALRRAVGDAVIDALGSA